MNSTIINIIKNKHSSIEAKERALLELEKDIDVAKKILSGEYKYCELCDDYYLSKSFIPLLEEKEEEICTYVDPINSGGNTYKNGIVTYRYLLCPKGHKHLIDRKE